jgi:NACHT domain
MQQALEYYYCDILDFHSHAIKSISRPGEPSSSFCNLVLICCVSAGWKKAFGIFWKSFETQFRRILDSLTRHKELIESEKGTATLWEVRKLREVAETDMEVRADREQQEHLSRLLEKLNAPDYRFDQKVASNHRRGSSSGLWVLQDEKYQKWFSLGFEENPLLYIHGIPGAGMKTLYSRKLYRSTNLIKGKSTLASLIIAKLQESKLVPVVFFYCKHEQSDKNNFGGVLRALIAQLCFEDHVLTSYLYSVCASKDHAGVTEALEELAEMAFDSKKMVFVVLDGLDECPPEEADKILSWLQPRLKDRVDADSGYIRLLCIGQRVHVLQTKLSSAADIRLENDSHLRDVERYVKEKACALKNNFELDSQDEREIVTRVVSGANGKDPLVIDSSTCLLPSNEHRIPKKL